MNKQPEISIIVPVYNDELHLEHCLNCLLNQTFTDFEVIMVDDGSTDRSSEICDYYCELDSRFFVKHQTNSGVAQARNTGLLFSSGRYIMFVDSDDTVEPDFCRIPFEIAEANNSDIVVFCYMYLSDENCGKRGPSKEHIGIVTSNEALNLLDEIEIYMWNKMFSRKLFSKISFIPGYICEEHAVLPKLIHLAESIYLSNATIYNYHMRADSLSSHGSINMRFGNDHYRMTLIKSNDLTDWGLNDLAQKYILKESFSYLYWFGLNESFSQDAMKNLSGIRFQRFFSFRQNVMILILNQNKHLFSLICRSVKVLRKVFN